ncbi:MAG: hypothetical protein CMN32_03145 [Saprospirales bacterium]|nr:hypothetical protein [Saprospirales bacterium]
MKHILTTTFVVFLFCVSAYAQVEKTIHQTFELDDVTTVKLEIPGEYEIIPWASSSILTETHIKLFNASPAILKHFVEKEKRYSFVLEMSEGTATLKAEDLEREPIKIRDVTLTEVVVQKIYLPENFVASNADNQENLLVRRSEE